jgi:hypothetical protein
VFVGTAGVFHLAFDAGLDVVFWVIRAEIDAAIASGFEFHLEDEIPETFLGPNVTAFVSPGERAIHDFPVLRWLGPAGVRPSIKGFSVEKHFPFSRGRIGWEGLCEQEDGGE